jgi:hypothetical protein
MQLAEILRQQIAEKQKLKKSRSQAMITDADKLDE